MSIDIGDTYALIRQQEPFKHALSWTTGMAFAAFVLMSFIILARNGLIGTFFIGLLIILGLSVLLLLILYAVFKSKEKESRALIDPNQSLR